MLLLLALLNPAPATPTLLPKCGVAQQPLYAKALGAKSGAALWSTEAELLEVKRGTCRESVQPAVRERRRIGTPVDLPRQPVGAGAGPWVLLGSAALLGGGVALVDFLANGARDDLQAAQDAGDREAYSEARDEFQLHQYIAWGLGGAALAAGVTGAFWLALGGEDDPVQSRPVFSAGPSGLAAGWSLDF